MEWKIVTINDVRHEDYPFNCRSTRYKGIIPGRYCGFRIQLKDDDDKYFYSSIILSKTEEVIEPINHGDWTPLGRGVYNLRRSHPEVTPTGKLVFEGYFITNGTQIAEDTELDEVC